MNGLRVVRVLEKIGASAAGRYLVTGERFDAPAAQAREHECLTCR